MLLNSWLTQIQKLINHVFNIQDTNSAPIIITLLVFISGWIITGIISFIKNVLERKAIRSQIYPILNSFITSAQRQADLYMETADSLNMDALKLFAISKADFYQATVITSLGYSKVFGALFLGFENYFGLRAFKRRKRMEAFSKCWQAIISIQFWQDKAIADLSLVLDKYNTWNEKRNKVLTEFEKSAYELHQAFAYEPGGDGHKYLKQVTDIRMKWNKLPNAVSPSVIHKNLVLPILEISESNLLANAQIIRFNLLDALMYYDNMNGLIQNYKVQFTKYANQIQSYASDVKLGQESLKQLW